MRLLINWGVVIALAMAPVACRRGDVAPLKELQRTHAGAIDVVVLSPNDALRQGKDSFVLEFRGADGTLVDVGTVKATATMPMAGMSPMFGTVELQRSDVAGRYIASTDIGMVGGWQMAVEWNGTAGAGATRFQQRVQ